MKHWKTALKGYTKQKIWLFLFLGFSCGLPYNLLASTLSLWLKDIGLSLAIIGVFGLVLMPYTFKFLWAPVVDWVRIPYLSDRFGAKKTWGILFQIGLVVSIFSMALFPPTADNWQTTFILAFCVAFFAASQDIVIDALRIDTLSGVELSEGASVYQFGYRMGLLLSGAGVVALSAYIPWTQAYFFIGCMGVLGMVALCFVKESHTSVSVPQKNWLVSVVKNPMVDFMRHREWMFILLFIVLYKLNNAVLGRMASPFYDDIGFTKQQIALVSGAIGPWITIAGVPIGGLLMVRLGVLKSLFVLGFVEMMTSVAFAVLSVLGPSVPAFFGVIVFDNIVGGMGGAVFVAYLSALCSKKYAATQYALLTGLMAFSASFVASGSGVMAEKLGWFSFFLLTAVLMMPALILLPYLIRSENKSFNQK